jgi:hypothetical protein
MRVVPLILIALMGCSAGMPSPQTIATTHQPCTTSRAAPSLDGLGAAVGGVAALFGLATIAAALGDEDDAPLMPLGVGFGVAGGVVAFAYGSSARHGNASAAACAARARWR